MNDFTLDVPYHLFSNCFPVQGINRSVIYDIERNNFEYIPNTLYDIITTIKNKSINEVLNYYEDIDEKQILLEYFEFLYNNEYIFFSTLNNKFFPDYKIDFQKPYNISALIIDISSFDEKTLSIIKSEIINIKVECLIIRFIESSNLVLQKVLSFFNDIPTRIIQLFTDESINITDENFDKLININQRISIIVKYNSNDDNFKKFSKGVLISTSKNVIVEQQKIKNISDFDINIDLYMESKLYNNYFYKKAYIDLNGNISRYEHDLVNFGKIQELDFKDLLKNKDFSRYWNIRKDDIAICCDCEYRYMCVDSRLPLYQKEDGFWVLENECNYDPYKSEWKKVN